MKAFTGSPALIVLAAAACSSHSPEYTATFCPSEGVTDSGCATCLLNSCAAEVAAINDSCSATDLSCGCPSGSNAADCSLQASCSNVGPAYQMCLEDNCTLKCQGMARDASIDPVPGPACTALGLCCGSLQAIADVPATTVASCYHVSESDSETSCSTSLTSVQAAGYCGNDAG